MRLSCRHVTGYGWGEGDKQTNGTGRTQRKTEICLHYLLMGETTTNRLAATSFPAMAPGSCCRVGCFVFRHCFVHVRSITWLRKWTPLLVCSRFIQCSLLDAVDLLHLDYLCFRSLRISKFCPFFFLAWSMPEWPMMSSELAPVACCVQNEELQVVLHRVFEGNLLVTLRVLSCDLPLFCYQDTIGVVSC